MGTTDNIFILHGLISHCINNNDILFEAFVDFQKAFGYIVVTFCGLNLWRSRSWKMLNVIKSREKFNNRVSSDFTCCSGVRQGECLSPILFSMYLNDIERENILKDTEGIDIGMLKLFLLLYAEDIILFANDKENLQFKNLNILENYCKRWKLKVNTQKTKVIVFRKGDIIRDNILFYDDGAELELLINLHILVSHFQQEAHFMKHKIV